MNSQKELTIKYPDSLCESHFNVKTSEPVCVICMSNEIERLRAENNKLLAKQVNSEVVDGFKSKKNGYPYTGITNDNVIVLFECPGTGVVLHTISTSSDSYGKYSEHWDEDEFRPWSGMIRFEN